MKKSQTSKQPTIFTVKSILTRNPGASKQDVVRQVIERDLRAAEYDPASVSVPQLFTLIEKGPVSSPSNISRRYAELVKLYPALRTVGRNAFISAPSLFHLTATPILRTIANDPNRNNKNEWIDKDGEMYAAVKDYCLVIPAIQLWRYEKSSAEGLPETYLQYYPQIEIKYKRLGNKTTPKRLCYIVPLADIDTYRKEEI